MEKVRWRIKDDVHGYFWAERDFFHISAVRGGLQVSHCMIAMNDNSIRRVTKCILQTTSDFNNIFAELFEKKENIQVTVCSRSKRKSVPNVFKIMVPLNKVERSGDGRRSKKVKFKAMSFNMLDPEYTLKSLKKTLSILEGSAEDENSGETEGMVQ